MQLVHGQATCGSYPSSQLRLGFQRLFLNACRVLYPALVIMFVVATPHTDS